MTVYATYSDYTGVYFGTAIAQPDFSSLVLQASAVIDQLTQNRAAPVVAVDTDTDTIAKITLACCALADEIQRQDTSGGAVSSESIGRNSVTYISKLSEDARLKRVAKRFLVSTNLMYAGFNDGEYGHEHNDQYLGFPWGMF